LVHFGCLWVIAYRDKKVVGVFVRFLYCAASMDTSFTSEIGSPGSVGFQEDQFQTPSRLKLARPSLNTAGIHWVSIVHI
jgi:hypothetical protein